MIIWYGLVPIAGACFNRYSWRQFRRRFDNLRLRPVLDYRVYRQLNRDGGAFRFTGGFESVTDGQTLWIQGEDLTIPVSLADAHTYLLPMPEGNSIPEVFDPGEEAPERIRWNRVSTLTEGARVFVGGSLVFRDERWIFVSTRETPLLVIFYDGPDRSLANRAIRAGRRRNEYWNGITPYALVTGALCQLLMAFSFLSRPAFRLTVETALTALFVPLFPLIPPGVLFTVLYRRLSWRARIFRAYRDLAMLPLRHLAHGQESGLLPNGEIYGIVRCESLPGAVQEGSMPMLIPEYSKVHPKTEWYAFGALRSGSSIPQEPEDPFATFGVLPGKPAVLARRYIITAYTLEIIGWMVLLAGIGLNIFFVRMILSLV